MNTLVSLNDKYTLERGQVYITDIQALLRLPLMQRQRDLTAGHADARTSRVEVEGIISDHVAKVTAYQNAAYA